MQTKGILQTVKPCLDFLSRSLIWTSNTDLTGPSNGSDWYQKKNQTCKCHELSMTQPLKNIKNTKSIKNC